MTEKIEVKPRDLYGEYGEIMEKLLGTDFLIRIAENIGDFEVSMKAKGLLLTEMVTDKDLGSNYVVYHEGQTLADVELSVLTDATNGFVWVLESQMEKYKSIIED